MLSTYSPDYFTSVGGGDVSPTSEQELTFPQYDAYYENVGAAGQDGTTGDATDSSGLWKNFAGIAGTFLRAFTGGQGVTVSGGVQSKPPTTAPQQQSVLASPYLMIGAGLLLLIVLILVLRK
jgi:hypothetical protein